MAFSHISQLPPELFHEIVSHIDDDSTLAAVALVCHNFLYEARRKLYSSVEPRDTNNALQHFRLLRTFVENPLLSTTVTSFRTSELVQSYEQPLCDMLHIALRQMSNLKRLHFRSFGGLPCGDLLLGCPFQLTYLYWGNHSEDMGEFFVVLAQQQELRYLHLECQIGSPVAYPEVCPRLEMLEGNFFSLISFLPSRNITAVSWIPELRESTALLSTIAPELRKLRMLAFGGYFARPRLSEIVDYIPAVEYLELVGYTMDELASIPRLSNLRRLVLTLGRPYGNAHSTVIIATRFALMQNLLQNCNMLERIDLMHRRKNVDEDVYECFQLSTPTSSTFTTSVKRQSLLYEQLHSL